MSTGVIKKDRNTVSLPDRVARFPFPFPADSYRYSTNVEPAGTPVQTEAGSWGSRIIDVDAHYLAELTERAGILDGDPSRLQVLPHMQFAVWDAIETLLPLMAEEHPGSMSFTREGNACHWRNTLQDLALDFTLGDDSSLPLAPLQFLGSQLQDDIALLDQRQDALWLDAGLVTFAADWSLGFDVGMKFLEVHGPVPRIHRKESPAGRSSS